jgi:hypothetical protein
MHGHAVAAADTDGDGWTDLFVAGFADRPASDYQVRGADGPAPDRLLLGGPDGFRLDDRFAGELARTSGAAFADLDTDGDLDLVVVRNPRDGNEIDERMTTVYSNDDGSWMIEAKLADDVAGRSVATVDIDRDGRLDLIIAGDRFGPGPSRIYRNDGDFTFTDTTREWGMPDDMATLAVAVADLNNDGWPDIVASGDARVLLGSADGFTVDRQPVLIWTPYGNEDDPGGIAIGDLDEDGLPDLVIGHHFNSTIDEGELVPVRVFLNRSAGGQLSLVENTEDAGIPALWTKSPHVDIVDVDNDGHLDIVTSAVSADGSPLILHNIGRSELSFEAVGEPGDGSYWVTGIADDVDHDGRIDLFMVEWEPTEPSLLFHNSGSAGHWVELDITELGSRAAEARVDARDPATGDLLGTDWVTSTNGYAAGVPLVARIGLGNTTAKSVRLDVVTHDGESQSIDALIDARHVLSQC